MRLEIELLNHASILLSFGNIRLLTDPWFSGTCFRGNWGLQFENPDAMERAAAATHLWISHFHGDHLHIPTLKELARKNPNLEVLANQSANFDMASALRSAGFQNIRPLPERQALKLGGELRVTRFPSTGIDNMLFIQAGPWNVLNLNDCNMPFSAFKSLSSRMGSIDVFLTNFNHAGKILDPKPDAEIRQKLGEKFLGRLNAFNPRWVIPFASMHFYRSPATAHQFASMLNSQDLARLSPKVLPLAMGDKACFEAQREPQLQRREPAVSPSSRPLKTYEKAADWAQIEAAAKKYRAALAHEFFGFLRWIPPIYLRITDLELSISLDFNRGIFRKTDLNSHIAMHSEAVMDWLDKPYGTDTFYVGGDFEIQGDVSALRRLLLAGALTENGLAPRQILKLLLSRAGRLFFWNRREEIWATVSGLRFRVGDRT